MSGSSSKLAREQLEGLKYSSVEVEVEGWSQYCEDDPSSEEEKRPLFDGLVLYLSLVLIAYD